MPFSESKGKFEEPSAQKAESESPKDYERERAERRRQDALAYLIETGRAKTPEEAERYLESLNRLKERLIAVLPDLVSSPDSGDPSLYYADSRGTRPLREPIESALRPEQLDRLNPRVWQAATRVAPAVMGSGITFEDALLLPMKGNRNICIGPGGSWFAAPLHEALSPEERELLYREHVLTRKELIKKLRETAQQWEDKPEDDNWRPLFGNPLESEDQELDEGTTE